MFGLALTALAVSGAAIYSLRIARERERPVRLARAFGGMWKGMGHWRWLSAALVLTGFSFCYSSACLTLTESALSAIVPRTSTLAQERRGGSRFNPESRTTLL